ncbi:uncharacterized protein PFL1_02382 [Pseudozyma flocculosa PF-1]|uniref:Lipocalin/cytosolic fatty-acid binding domain-containing protein n=1 Tax=Pseudozyma flocculosa TaxID=84751 RepID=A0A5C3F5M1_9BASI|nr:uncharacterized protein PFL1_02382 [Pseudozyma flocculosa PF-1]EPQ30266.1 hypothetical protein PFL1_02382 [Pseudozyma flocculosa PF-1]SPO39794.1 uncharacterized protein PSFLO_05275 [Pseudozyma flocculosa]
MLGTSATKLSLLLASTSVVVGASPLLSARQDSTASGSGNSSSLPTFPVGLASATWDGELFYPKPIDDFEATKYVGPRPDGDSRPVWYQWAASEQPFLKGCRCVYARYGTNENGTVSVENSCTRGDRASSIKGYAAPTPDYGDGSFQVAFFGAKPDQRGPNYVVTRAFSNKPGEDLVRLKNADSRDDEEDNNTNTNNNTNSNDNDNDNSNDNANSNDNDNDNDNDNGRRKRDEDGTDDDAEEERYETVIVGSQNFSGWFLLSRTRTVQTDIVEAYLREVADAGFDLTKPYEIYDQENCGAEPPYNPDA